MLLLCGLLVLFLSRPYLGIVHDARLYIGFGVSALEIGDISSDLVFTADGQSKYSVFPQLIAALITWIGPSRASLLFVVGGLVAWYFAFRYFAARFIGQMSAAALCGVAIISFSVTAGYGPTGVFKFAEPYATPRILAEALALVVFARLLMGKPLGPTALLVAFGMALHPIMSSAATAVVVAYLVSTHARSAKWRFWTTAASTGVLAVVLALPIGGGAFARFDQEWLDILDAKESLVFVRWWYPQDHIRTFVQFMTLLLARGLVNERTRRFLDVVLLLGVLGLSTTWIGADVISNVVLTSVQPWRTLWIVAIVAVLCLVTLINSVVHVGSTESMDERNLGLRRAAVLFLTFSWWVVEFSSNAVPLTILAALMWFAARRTPTVGLPRIGVPLVAMLIACLTLGSVVAQTLVTMQVASSAPDVELRSNWNYLWMTGVPALVFLVIGIWMLGVDVSKLPSRRLGFGVAALFLLVLSKWNSRLAFQRVVESGLDAQWRGEAPVLPLAKKGPVLWLYGDLEAWAFTGHPSWGTPVQGVPSVFSRKLAVGWNARWQRLKDAGLLPKGESAQHLIADKLGDLAVSNLSVLCASPDSPTYVVVPANGALLSGTFSLPAPKLMQPVKRGEEWNVVKRWRVLECQSASGTP